MIEGLISLIEGFLVLFFLFIVCPIWAYLIVKYGTMGHLEGKEKFLLKKMEELKRMLPEGGKDNEGDEENS